MKQKLNYMLWCTGYYKGSAVPRIIKELKEEGRYLDVKRGTYSKCEYTGEACYRIMVALPEHNTHALDPNEYKVISPSSKYTEGKIEKVA